MGTIEVELYWKHAPSTCRNFAELARRSYYNNVKFHRVIRDFMIQGRKELMRICLVIISHFYIGLLFIVGGDPTGTGRGGSSIYGKKFNDEIHEDLKHTGLYRISITYIFL